MSLFELSEHSFESAVSLPNLKELASMTTTSGQALAIDAVGLDRLSCNAKADPTTGKKTLKAKTLCESGFRNLTYVRDLAPMLVGEPPALLGDDAAPNPSETVLAALGSCIAVGLLANATHRGVGADQDRGHDGRRHRHLGGRGASVTRPLARSSDFPRFAARCCSPVMPNLRCCRKSTTTPSDGLPW